MGFLAPIASAIGAALTSAIAITAYATTAVSFGLNWAIGALTKQKSRSGTSGATGDKRIGVLYSFSGYETQVNPRNRIGVLYGTTRVPLQRIIAYISGIACQQRDIVSAVYGVCEGEIDTNSTFDLYLNDKNYDDLDTVKQGASPINSKTLKTGTNTQTALAEATNFFSTFSSGVMCNPYTIYRASILDGCRIDSNASNNNYSMDGLVAYNGTHYKRVIGQLDMSGYAPTGAVSVLEMSFYLRVKINSSSVDTNLQFYVMNDPVSGVDSIDLDTASWDKYDASNSWPGGGGGYGDRYSATNFISNYTAKFLVGETAGLRKITFESTSTAVSALSANNGFFMICTEDSGANVEIDFSNSFVEVIYAPQSSSGGGSSDDNPVYDFVTYGDDVSDLSVSVSFPYGIYELSGGGYTDGLTAFNVGYKPHGSGSYTNTLQLQRGASASPMKINVPVFSNQTPGQWDIRIEVLSYELATGTYDGNNRPASLSASREQRLRLDSVNEGRGLTYRFPNTALIGLKLEATEQVSGGLPSASAVLDGLKVRVYTDSTTYSTVHSSNPAWCALDFITNERYGLGVPISKMDVSNFLDFASFCTDNSFECNYFSNKNSGRDILNDILFPFRAAIIESPDGMRVIWDTARTTPSWRFFSQTETQVPNLFDLTVEKVPETAKPTRVKVDFLNEDQNYETAYVSYEDQTAVALYGVKESEMTLESVTNATLAESFAKYSLKKQRLNDIIITFKTNYGASILEPLDLIEVTHDFGSFAWTSKKFIVLEVSKSFDPTDVRIKAIVYDADVYT